MTIHRDDTASAPESDEQYVREVIDSAMSGTRARLDLGTAALARGRRLRRRRRLATAATIAAAGALAGTTGGWLLSGPDTGEVATDPTVASPSPPQDDPVDAPVGYWDVPSADMVRTLTAILPDGIVLTDTGSLEADTEQGGPAHGYINSTLGANMAGEVVEGNINVMLWPDVQTWTTTLDQASSPQGESTTVTEDDRGEVDRLSCDAPLGHFTSCRELRVPDGTLVGRRAVTDVGDLRTLEVTLNRDGGMVYAAVANTVDRTWGSDSPITAPAPLLTMDQLEDLVRNDAWVSYVP